MRSATRKTVAWAGALLTSALMIGAVAAAPLGIADTDDNAEGIDRAVEILDQADIKSSAEWQDTYPHEFASFMQNDQNIADVDYLEEYPFLSTLYAGNAFSKAYEGARGHTYALEDVAATARAPQLANCLSCKTPQMNALIASGDESVYSLPFQDVLELTKEPVGCYTCHENTGSELVVTNVFLNNALGDDVDAVAPENKVCGQCHDEYYFDPTTKATMLPYTSLETMTPDAILAYYNDMGFSDYTDPQTGVQFVKVQHPDFETVLGEGNSLETMTPDAILAYYNDMGFSDYTDPQTGVQFVKVQHPDFETVLGEGNKMAAMGYTCADCHMGTSTDADGTEFADHFLRSPLENDELIANDCSQCHKDLAGEVEAIQKATDERVRTIGQKLADLTETLAAAKEAGTVSDEDFEKIADLNRTAMFYWDFVFVENGDGAHNSALANDCLDKAEAAVDEALGMLK